MKKAQFKWTLLILIPLFWIISCETEATDEPIIDPCNPSDVAGELLEATYFLTFTPEEVQAILNYYGAPIGLELDYTVDAYRVSYRTLDKHDELSKVSGLMLIPQGLDTLDLMSVQHGTVFERDEVGSVHPYFTAEGLITAMNGYLVVVPDYLGLGDSQLLHPYLHAGLSANAVIDMLRAAQIYACQNEMTLSDKLFLAGYSEGGFITLATHKIIEAEYADEFQLTAVAPMAGPYDLLGTTRNLLNRSTYANPGYIAYIVVAYNDIYEWNRLGEIFREPYASRIPGLFDGNHISSEINAQLTTNIDSLLTSEFKASFIAGEETQLETALLENSLLDWGPIAPVRLFHGTSDSTVFYENSVSAFESMQTNGGLSVDLVPLAGANHETAALPAYYLALEWFDSLRTSY